MSTTKYTDAEERRALIIKYLEQNGQAEVACLSRRFAVSDMTVRRDLEKLEKEEKLIRVHGGARLIKKAMYEAVLSDRIRDNFQYKDEIARYCVQFIEDGDVIALDASSTALALARYITAKVQVVTNNISIAQELSTKENVEIVLLGGNVRKKSCSTVGFTAAAMMKDLMVDKLFLSSKALAFDHGISDATQNEGEMKKAMLQSCEKVILMADCTKLGTKAFYKVAPVECADMIVTNYLETYSEAQQKFIDQCEENNVKLHLVGKNTDTEVKK